MATYFTDFEEYSTGSAPSDWSFQWNANDTWTVETTGSDKYLQLADPDSTQVLTWDDVDGDAERQDAEVVMMFRRTGGVSTVKPFAIARLTGSGGTSRAYRTGGGGAAFQLYKYVDSTTSSSIGSVSFSIVGDTDYWMRLRVNGTTVQARIWEDGVSEPSAWTGTGTGWAAVTATDSDVTGDGATGVGSTSLNNQTWRFWQVGVGTNGDTAPTSGAPAGPPTLTGISASGITSSGATLTITAS